MMEFQVPDFGFEDQLNTDTSKMGIWNLLYDHVRE